MIIDSNISEILTQWINEDISRVTLENFTDVLDNRTISRLGQAWILTVKDLFLYSHRIYNWRINWLWKRWIENITKLKELIINNKTPFNFSENWSILPAPSNVSENLSEVSSELRQTSLLEYPNFLTTRTLRALNRHQIFSVNDILEYRGFFDAKSLKWLWVKWFTEIRSLLAHLNKGHNMSPVNSTFNTSDFKLLINDQRLTQILSFNLISSFRGLEDYVIWKKDWKELQYFNEDDIEKLRGIYNKCLYEQKSEPNSISVSARMKLSNFWERDLIIIKGRILWNKTLETLWSELGITRERVRQKQIALENHLSKIWKKIIESNSIIFTQAIKLIQDNSFIVLPKDINHFKFLGFDNDTIRILFHVLRGLDWVRWDYLEGDRSFVIYRTDIQLDWNQLRDMYKYLMEKLLKNNEDLRIDDLTYEYIFEDKNMSEKDILLPQKSDIALFFSRVAELHPDYVMQDNIIHRFKKKYKLSHYIEEVLKEYPDGLHFREIAQKIHSRYWIEAPENKVYTHLGKTTGSQKYVNIWKGLFTLKWSWLYSWEKTPDIIYTYLRDSGTPKTIGDIETHVLERKRIDINTIRASFDYKNESRFIFYNDGKVWLKEWNLWNVRPKRNNTYNNNSIF